jgi:hypothetical protein
MAIRGIMKLLEGYAILPKCASGYYCGIDRNPFEPLILPEALEDTSPIPDELSHLIWPMYPEGWRKNAYRLFEENLVESSFNSLQLVRSIEAARELLKIVNGELEQHGIIHCQLGDVTESVWKRANNSSEFFGFDVAYPGGDYYSAIKNGIHIAQNHKLINSYGPHLNSYGLFADSRNLVNYLSDFKDEYTSEASADFVAYMMILVE